jgi:hypothetical protein
MEKTCKWHGIDSKPDHFIPPPPIKPIKEFTFDRHKIKAAKLFKKKAEIVQKKARSIEEILDEKVYMKLVDFLLDQVKNKRMYNTEVQDTVLNVKEDVRLMEDVDCTFL